MSKKKSFADTLPWKNFMKYVNGIGAAIVIVGALFKIMHYPGAGIILPIGMGVEVIIFLLTTLDTVHLDPDWTKVYPELADNHSEHPSVKAQFPPSSTNAVAPAVGNIDTSKFADGINAFSNVALELSSLSGISETAGEMNITMKKASSTIKQFSNSYEQSTQVLTESANILSESYQTAAQSVITYSEKTTNTLIDSGKKVVDIILGASNQFSETYEQIGKELDQHLSIVKDGNTQFEKQLNVLNKSMSNFAVAQELQIKELGRLENENEAFHGVIQNFIEDVKVSSEETKKFRKGVTQLSESLNELNNIYGNMLLTINAYSKKK